MKSCKKYGKNGKFNEVFAIILDEIHERTINSEVIMGIMKETVKNYPKLKVLLTSATVDKEAFSQYFNNCRVIEIPGMIYPVSVNYRPFDSYIIGS